MTGRSYPTIRKGIRSGFKFGFDIRDEWEVFRKILPFKRSWPAIVVVAAIDAAFIIPAVITFKKAVSGWSRFDLLFDLVAALFLSAWLLGWVIAPLILTGILLLMLSGREILKAGTGTIDHDCIENIFRYKSTP